MPSKQCPNGHTMRELQSKCSKCGWHDEDGLSKVQREASGPPKFCTWRGCDQLADMITVEVELRGMVYRRIAGEILDRNGNPMGGYKFVRWVARCHAHDIHEKQAVRPDWRDAAIAEFQREHPEFAVVPTDEQEKRDMLSMCRAFLQSFQTREAA